MDLKLIKLAAFMDEQEKLGAGLGLAKFLGSGAKQLGGLFRNPAAMAKGARNLYKKKGLMATAKKFAPGAALAGGIGLAGYGGGKLLFGRSQRPPQY